MKNRRSHSLIIGNKILTGMTAREVNTLTKIMSVPEATESSYRFISINEYIEKHNPAVRRWTSKAGTDMIAVQILHDIIDRKEDEMAFPVDAMYRNSLPLK